MTTNKLRRAIAAALCLACLILAVIGGINDYIHEKGFKSFLESFFGNSDRGCAFFICEIIF